MDPHMMKGGTCANQRPREKRHPTMLEETVVSVEQKVVF